MKYFLNAGDSSDLDFLISELLIKRKSTSSFSINASASFCQSRGSLPGLAALLGSVQHTQDSVIDCLWRGENLPFTGMVRVKSEL